ncbi:odorant receptor 49b-like [Cataglyphis hispanica]|uniref:odorant receptor 49b-like n=1 Tax=Cataglyphis hispanica TaxID=1086592 RepID=UPI00217FB86F|nr:odorant receptor 49b-like [Cataglyphis hispanica]
MPASFIGERSSSEKKDAPPSCRDPISFRRCFEIQSAIRMVSDKSFTSVIRANVALLKLSGVVSYKNGNIRQTKSQNVLSAIAYGCLFAYAILYTYEFALHTVYLDTWMESFTMILSLVGGQARFTLVLLFRSRFQRLLMICEQLWTALNATEKRCVRDYVKATGRLTYYYLFGCAFTIFFYAVASLFIHNDSLNATTRTLPYACPIQVHRSPYYEIMYILQLSSMTNVGLTCVAADTLGPVLILTICGHFKVLNSRLLCLSNRDRVYSEISYSTSPESLEITHDISRNCVKSDLEACAHYHQTVLEFCNEVEKLTNGIFLTQLLGSTYNISLVGFKLAGDDPDKFKYTSQLSIAIIQLFLCNWPADVLLTESQDVAKATYFTSWYRFPYQLKRSLNIIMMRAQKPAQLTAGYIVPLSLPTFASMVSSAASFFTMIRSMN